MISVVFRCAGVDETHRIGVLLGEAFEAGTVLLLKGELGVGKTCLVRGIAEGIGVDTGQAVTSPSYALIHEYTGRLRLFHVDLYRIGYADLEDIGFFDLPLEEGVLAVEWAERLPEDAFSDKIEATFDMQEDENRIITITGRGEASRRWLQLWIARLQQNKTGHPPAMQIVEEERKDRWH